MSIKPYRMKPGIAEDPEPQDNPRHHPHDPFFGEENQADSPRFSLAAGGFLPRPPRPSEHFLKSGRGAKAVSTGLPGMDRLLGGGLHPGALTVVVGAPGTLKTSLCTQIGISLCLQGHPTVILLADEAPSSHSLISRIYRQAGSSADIDALLTQPDHEDHIRLDALPLELLDAEVSVEGALALLREGQRSEKPPVLIVDSAQKASLGRPYDDLHDRVNGLLKVVSRATRDDGLITLLISKASRESYQWKASQVSPVAAGGESSYLESDADVLIHLSGDRSRIVTAALLKTRMAAVPLDSVALEIDDATGRIVDITPERLAHLETKWSEISDARRSKRRADKKKKRQKEAEEAFRKKLELVLARLDQKPGLSESTLMAEVNVGRDLLKKLLAKAEGEGRAHWQKRKGGGHSWFAGAPSTN